MNRLCLLSIALVICGWQLAAAAELDYAAADPALKLVVLDSSPTESFLAVRADTAGRLFVGGREALFVYEPDDQGGYHARRELYRFPNHTWVYDIAVRGDDLYVMTVSALYVIRGGVTKREGLTPQRLIWGVPLGHVHQCFHGLAWGPEGDLYLSMGDPVWYYGDFSRPDHWGHWTFFSQPEGTKTPYTGVGGVFRCRPDGTRFQVVSRGLRNSCGLVFDQHWNLFTNDNDHESMATEYVPGRLNHVTPHSYFSWPRGWMPSKTPDRADLLETLNPSLGRFVPVGQSYYNNTLLPEAYRNNLLVARWCTRAVTRYPLEHHGATFHAEEQPLLIGQNHARPVGVAVGRGGRIFVTISFMAHNENSPVYKSDLVMITRADDPSTHPFEPYEATEAAPEQLFTELSHQDWSRREVAHVELLRRGGELLKTDAAARLEEVDLEDPAARHLVWLAAAGASDQAAEAIALVAQHSISDDLRLQSLRALTEYPELGASPELFLHSLDDPNPQVQHAAVLAFFGLDTFVPEAVNDGPARSKDTYLRQAATLLLAEKAGVTTFERMCRVSDSATRLAGVLAAGFKLTLPPTGVPIPEALPLDALRTEDAYVIQFADATIDLRQHGRIGNFTVADHWRLGAHTPEQERLFELLVQMLGDKSEAIRLQAAHFLYLLNDPRSEPLVSKVTALSEERRLISAPLQIIRKLWLAGPFDDRGQGFDCVHPPEQGPVDPGARYTVDGREITWQPAASDPQLYDLERIFGRGDGQSYYGYCRLESAKRQRILLLVGSDDGVRVWRNAQLVWTNDALRGALPYQDAIFLELEPGSNDLLVRVRNVDGAAGLYLHTRTMSDVISVLPEPVGADNLAVRLRDAAAGGQQDVVPAAFLEIDWSEAAAQGNAENGRKLFQTIGCAKCHAVETNAAALGGPSLAGAAQRFTVPYLVESILLPSKQISPVFKATVIQTTDGVQATGLVVGETAERIELVLLDTKKVEIAKDKIEARELRELSPMPQGVVKQPDELRDILAYLLAGARQ
ncbi:MAG: c-type cytochrome [Planctomycetes bacterium]|nr:c-type cytochrome [Planctomycetota bacterium]